MSYELYLGDWLELAASLQDNSIDAIITDPPYGTTQLEWDTAPDLMRMFQEFKRIAKPHAPMVIFSAQPFTTDLINAGRDIFRYEVIWKKTMPTGFLDCRVRPLRNHENIILFSSLAINGAVKRWPTYNPQFSQATPKGIINRKRTKGGQWGEQKNNVQIDDGKRQPKTIISFSNAISDNFHPTQKPLDLLTYLVKTYSNECEIVFDPFSGSGTTAHACLLTGRNFIGAELSFEYHAKAIKRLEAVMAQPRLEFA